MLTNLQLEHSWPLLSGDETDLASIHGWEADGVVTFQSGSPFTMIDSSANNLEDTDGINALNFATLAWH